MTSLPHLLVARAGPPVPDGTILAVRVVED